MRWGERMGAEGGEGVGRRVCSLAPSRAVDCSCMHDTPPISHHSAASSTIHLTSSHLISSHLISYHPTPSLTTAPPPAPSGWSTRTPGPSLGLPREM